MQTIKTSDPTGEKPKGHIRGIWAILIIVVIAMLVGGGIWYFFYKTTVEDTGNLNTVKVSPSASTNASTSVSPSASASNETAGWKIYTNSTYDFSIKYPSDWEYKEFPISENEGMASFSVRFNNKTLNQNQATSQDYIFLYLVEDSNLKDEIYWGEKDKDCTITDKTIAGINGKNIDCTFNHFNYIVVNTDNTAYNFKIESDKNKTVFDKMIGTLQFTK